MIDFFKIFSTNVVLGKLKGLEIKSLAKSIKDKAKLSVKKAKKRDFNRKCIYSKFSFYNEN